MRLWLKLCLTLFILPSTAIADEVLRLGFLAFRPTEQLVKQWQPLADYLSQTIPGHQVQLQVLSQSEMNQALLNNELDFVMTNPSHFVQLRESSRLTGALATLNRLENGLPGPVLAGALRPPQSRSTVAATYLDKSARRPLPAPSS